jgi:hypothetical protein
VVHLHLLRVTQKRVILVVFIITLIGVVVLIVVFIVVVLVVVDVVGIGVVLVVIDVVAVILQQLLMFCRCFLRLLFLRHHDHNLEGLLLLRNVLRRVVLSLQLRWYVPWCHLADWQASSALAGCSASMNHLKFGNRRE